ncbi:MAG: GAF domain-containing protein, partial [Chloroflexi bacterium]|nr:GAF domain-containing protein [Chloroflexota bacterium]
MLRNVASYDGARVEGIFVIDREQRIVEWSDAAAATLGVSHDEAIGRRCFEVVRGRGPFGRPACRRGCSALEALRQGRVAAGCSVLLDKGSGTLQRVRCELLALPTRDGGALARLRERVDDWEDEGLVHVVSSASPISVPVRDVVGDLAVLANLSTTLSLISLSSIESNVERALDVLREAVGAESAELFLSEQGGGMLLSFYRGPFKNAFSQITRFLPGKGYPGLVSATREPIVTRSLADDPRYLRTMVKEKGFESYLCVPLCGPSGVIGSLDLAWRSRRAPIEDALRLVLWASSPLGMAMENTLYRLREAGAGSSLGGWGLDLDPDLRLRDFLRGVLALGNAAGAVMICYDPSTGAVVKRVFEGQPPRLVCVAPGSAGDEVCPALADARGVALYGPKDKWAPACRRAPAWPAATYCIPIVSQGRVQGMVQLGYSGRVLSPPTQYLRLLYEMAQGTIPLLRETLVQQQSQRLLLQFGLGSDKSDSGPGHGSAVPLPTRDSTFPQNAVGPSSEHLVVPPRPAPIPSSGPEAVVVVLPAHAAEGPGSGCAELDIRCLGTFELLQRGKVVPVEAFGRRAALTLLKILLLRRGNPLARDALAELLWPEVDPEAGARRVYVTVHALRQVLESGNSGQAWKYVCSSADKYYFNLKAPVRVDLNLFEAHVRQAKLLEKNHDPAGAIAAYISSTNLYRGDLFHDEPYAEWCWEEREHLRQQFIDVVLRLAELLRERGEPAASVDCCRRALQVDPLREEIHRELMLSLWKAGRRSEAL